MPRKMALAIWPKGMSLENGVAVLEGEFDRRRRREARLDVFWKTFILLAMVAIEFGGE